MDGVGKFFIEHFLLRQKDGEKFLLNKVLPLGIADSKPMFYNLLSGKTAFNYGASLNYKDHLFRQMLFAGTPFHSFVSDYVWVIREEEFA